MKTILNLSVLFLILLAAQTRSFALMSVEELTKKRAKELGLEIRATATGPDSIWVVLEFDAKGALGDFARVELESREEGKPAGKLLLSSTVKEERSIAGRVVVTFSAGRASLDTILLKLVSGVPVEHVGRFVRLKDFVDLTTMR